MAVDPSKSVRSIRTLAKLVGKSPSAVRKWTRHPAWVFSTSGPWTADDVRLIRGWVKRYLRKDEAQDYREALADPDHVPGPMRPLTPIEQAKLDLLVERKKTLQQRRAVELKLLHVAKDCEANILRVALDVRGRLLAMPRTIAHALVGLDAPAIEELLNQQVRTVLKALVASLSLHGTIDPHGSDHKPQ